MRKKRSEHIRAKSPSRRGLSFLLAGMMAFSAVAPGLGSYSAYGVMPDKPVNSDGSIPNGNKPQDTINTEEVYINDTPIRLQVSKVKTAKGDHEGLSPKAVESTLVDTITYKVSGRIEGTEHDLMDRYGKDQIELAYSTSGTYLGYGWLKGTLEYLSQRKKQNVDEEIDIKYNQLGIFEGYAYVTKTLETADDVNRYVAGATMTLYDAVEIFYDPSAGYDMDDKWTGVTVVREPGSNNVQMVYVNKGHAGNRIEYVLQKEDKTKVTIDGSGTEVDDNYNYKDAINDEGGGVWIAKTIQREDTPILFYSFDNLHVTTNDEYVTNGAENRKKVDEVFGSQRYNKEDSLYGFDKEGNIINADQYDNRDFSIYAFEDGETKPVFEFTGSNFRNIHYSQNDKKFRFYDEDRNEDKEMRMYHLDEDGNRDAMVDPATGIAYLTEHIKPLEDEGSHDNIHHPNDDFISDNDVKFFVWPVNTFYDGTGNADDNSKGSHYFQKIITTRPATIDADTENEYVFGTLEDGKFENSLNPVLDQYGHPIYNRVSSDTYVKGHDRYDYDGEEYLGYTYEDGLDVWNENAYVINDHYHLYNTDEDDPFNQETHYQYTDKQPIKVTVDVDNNFIVNGHSTVPVPSREGYVFAGWLLDPDQLTDQCTVKAYWRNGNNSMSPEDEAMWYSSRGAEGQTKTLTVTFDANGGAFRAGQGDIHSTDFPLYRRLGDAYIINNTWLTGENTPNDPFDITKIDTVGNTAAGKNTISGDGLTANDVYSSSTWSGGQADMLKRLPRSLYIMEELEAPAGYVKGMPVPITMNEKDNVQTAEMVDTTIKVEIIKADATDDYYKKVRRNGELVKTAGGEDVTKIEPKGAYSYKHVKGATLSMIGADNATKKAFSDWVSITSCTDFVKKSSGGTWYIEFDSTKPLFLEGIPAGTYTISEARTPAGFVTMAPQTITVGEYEGVQIFSMSDDHTKVEIEKYWTDEDGTRRLLGNGDRAKLGLYDADGELVDSWYTSDASDYTSGGTPNETAPSGNLFTRAWSAVTSLFTARTASEETDYTAFTTRFQSIYNEGTTDVDRISWNVRRTAQLKAGSTAGNETWKISDGTEVTVTGGIVPETAPEGFAAAYAAKEAGMDSFEYTDVLSAVKDQAATTSMGDQYWNVDNGTVIHICVSVDDDSSSAGYQSYIADYQFEYRKLSGKYDGVVTYLTVDGTQRFDYLPVGTYKIRELEAPEGFAVAGEKEIHTEETGDIQIFDLENKKKEMKIAKYMADGEGRYFAGYYDNEIHYTSDRAKAVVIAGVTMNLYRSDAQITAPQDAFKDGKIPAGAVLVDSWVTGSDGTYTQYEYERELITKEMVGQLKPHTVKDVRSGWYYLVEPESMNYMLDAAPVEFSVTDETMDTELASYAMVNRTAPLAVRIHKTDQNGTALANAVFELTNKDTGAVIGTLVTDENGDAAMNVADTGRFGQDGRLVPYTFILKEISAPSGYMLNAEQHEFTLSEHSDGYTCSMFNNTDDSIRGGVLYVKDEPSQISISKQDLYSGDIVEGTVLEVTKAEYTDGKWQSDGNKKSEWTWTVDGSRDEFGLRGITPDTTYVLHEASVPSGYTKQGDVFFHINQNGLGIDKIWTDPEEIRFVSFDTDAAGEVEAMHTSTRTIAGTKSVITDLDNGTSFERGVEKNGRILLTAQEVTEGHRYNVRTYVTMSDTSVLAVDSITFLAELVDNEVVVWAEYASDPRVSITDSDGNTIYEIAADGTDTTILNPEASNEATLKVADSSRAGKDRSGVKAGDVITYQVDYHGKGKQILVYPGTGLTISRTEPGALQTGDGSYLYETTAESGTLMITANVNSDALTAVSMKVTAGKSELYYLNPIVTSGKTGPFAGNDSLVISNAVSGTDPENGTAEFSYTVTLTKPDGNALSGSYDYRTRLYSGTLDAFGEQKSFTMVLTGDDYLVINGLPDDTRYTVAVETKVSDGFKTDKDTAEGTIGENATVNEIFTSHRSITAERALLKKGQSYYLNETIRLSSRSHVTAGYGFSLDDKCRVTNFILLNRPSTVEVEKIKKDTQSPLAGAVLTVTDAEGNTVMDAEGNPLTWTTTREPKELTGILEPGKTYFLKELSAPEGYTMSEPVAFTVSEDGAVDRIIMQDAVTDVVIKKVDAKTGQSLAGAVLQVIDKEGAVVAEWTTDETGSFQLKEKLTAGETYTLHEKETVKGYYYSYDVVFTVNTDGKPQNVEMRNREIIVVTDKEFPEEPPETGTYPSYTMEKERVSLAPAKKDTEQFGFIRGDRVLYDVTITNTGETRLTMDVDDAYENPGYFTTPEVVSIKYYTEGSSQPSTIMGRTNSVAGSVANITIEAGGYAVVRYAAYVLDTAPESLSNAAADDGLGYLNTATTTNVTGISREYSGEDKDGDGKGDIITEKTVTKEDYPDELGDKEDTANTPVQEPDGGEGGENPSYTMDKTRTTKAPEKGETARFGFYHGDEVTYEARITNTGDMPLKMFVSDEYAPTVRDYFEGLKIVKIEAAEDISESGMGIGTDTARIRLTPGQTAVVTFTATVSENAPESLAFMAVDDGNGYLNTVRTYNVKAEKQDGTEGGSDEYPGIPDKEDDANTPVQTPSEEHRDYPFIWLVKGDKAQQGMMNQLVIPGGTYQVIDKASDGTETVMMEISDPDSDGQFTMTGAWKEWDIVLEADKTYYLREIKAPAGYLLPEGDTAFTVSHYGEHVVVPIYNEKTRVSFEKTDFAGREVSGVECELLVLATGGWKSLDSWVSRTGGPHIIEGVLEPGKEYLYKESAAPEGYAYSASIRFTLGSDGAVTHARYVDDDGKNLVYGSDGRPTDVTCTETLAGAVYQLNGEELALVDGNLTDKAGKVVVEGAAVELPVEGNVVIMKDDVVTATFEKTDFAGREIAGADCTLSEKKADGTTEQIDRWVSEEGSSHIMDKTLKTGTTYLYHEELAAPGYGYSYDIAFTVDKNGKIINAHYLDPDGNKVLYDRTGFPTGIIVMDDGTYRDGATPVWIDENGDAVDADGHVHARGVKLDIPTADNVVTMKDEPVKVLFTKYDDNGNALEGGSYSICGEGNVPVKAVKDTSIPSLEHEGMILKGEDLTFAAKKAGIRIDGLLEAGRSYTLKENEAPKGYTVSQTGVTFEAPVYNQAEAVTVSMSNQKIPARFAKADGEGNLIAGASLELYEESEDGTWKLVRKWTSTASPLELDGILEGGKNYRYHEVKAPEGYQAAPDILFTIDAAGVIQNARYDGDGMEVTVAGNTVTMDDKPLSVSFSKTDFAGEEVEGAECILYKKEADGTKTLIDAWTSGKEDHIISGKLSSGSTYIYHEEKAPEGYGYSEDIEFTIGEDGHVTSAHYINENGETILYDKDGYLTSITVQEDGTYKDGDTIITINEDGNAVDADGKVVAEGVKKDMPVVGNVVVMKDAPTEPTFVKVDAVTGKPLAGATLQVIDKDGSIIIEWTTDETGTFKLENRLTAGETYTLREKETVDGYYYSRDVSFTVNKDGKPQTVQMRNREIIVVTPPDKPEEPDPEKPIIWLLKHAVGDPDHILKGGTFQILSEDKAEVLIDSFTMDGTWQEWDVVLQADHSYWLHEVKPPEGYAAVEDVKFTVSHYGEDITVDMEDEPTNVTFKKVDQLTGVSLAGAVLQVYKGHKKAPYAVYDPVDKVAEWTTDETGTFKLTGKLEAGQTYTLREQETVDGYYYSYDIEFVVNRDGGEQVVEMQNRKIIVEVPPDELPKPVPEPEGTKPEYTMEKERTSLAPAKAGTDQYGFFRGDKVYYDVTITNTGEIPLTMDVDDAFEEPRNFTEPEVSAVRFFASDTGRKTGTKGSLNRVNGSVANITIQPGGYAVVTYSAYVQERAAESLSNAAADDGLGYLNTATTTDVKGTYKEYSGEDEDGDGKGDTVTEVTVTKDDYPDELGDKKDTAYTPVQGPGEGGENPSYTMDKTRPTKAPEKEGTARYGFNRGDKVTYEVHITNTGDMPLKMYVSDEFAYEIRTYFEDLKIVGIEGEDLSGEGTGMGIGTDTARIRIEPGKEAVVTYEATVSQTAPERLAFLETDDGNGYLNTARTYEVRAEKPDSTEGGPDEYPGIPDKEDDAHTPVQTPEEPPKENPPGPNEPEYPVIWLLKNSVNDPSHILPGGTFQLLDEDKNPVTDVIDAGDDKFGIGNTWKQWITVLKADHTYWLHEVTPPEGYLPAEDVKFTVSHYGERVEAVMTDKRKNDGITFSKQDFAGNEVAGATCSLYEYGQEGTTLIESWVSSTSQHTIRGKLVPGKAYLYREEKAPEGYGYSVDVVFTVDEEGNVTSAHYVDKDGKTILYDEDGYPTEITVNGDGTYSLKGETVTINHDGDVVDADGTVLAAKVQAEIPVSGNIVIIKDEPIKVRILKTDANGNAISGGKFAILDAGKNQVKAVSNTEIPSTEHDGFILKGEKLVFAAETDGVTITKQLFAGKEYYLHEVQTPEGYKRADDVMFTIPYAKPGMTTLVRMQDPKTEVLFAKTDFAGKEVEGAECILYKKGADGTKTQIDAWTSGKEEHVITGKLSSGNTYIYHEEKAPEGYGYSESIEFTVDDDGNVTSAHYINKDGETILYDKDGFATSITVQEDGTYKDGDTIITINEDGNAVDADGKVVAEGVKTDIPVVGNMVVMKDAPTDVTIGKVDAATGKSLAGATLQVIDRDGKTIAEWTTDETGTFKLENRLTAGESYILREKETVDGYYYSRDVSFTVAMDGKPQTVEMRNIEIIVVTPPDKPEEPDPEKPIIWLLKHAVGDPDHILKGGTFQILSEDKAEVLIDSFTMDGTWQEWDVVLKADHSYWFHEVTPPEGYAAAEDVKFTVSHYGEDITVDMEDEPTNVIIKKTDSRTGESLADATLQLLDKDRKVIREWTTDETGTFSIEGLVKGETYTLHESGTPEGYYYSYDVQFTVDGSSDGQTVVMTNREIVVVTPPDEYPDPKPDPQGTHPDYELVKERVSLAPAKAGTGEYGFFCGDQVLYDVTVTNTGETDLTMTVTDDFEIANYFSTPEATAVRFYYKDGREGTTMGSIISMEGNEVKLKLAVGGYAVIRYEADVLDAAKELLSGHAVDDGLGYLNAARTTDVTGTYKEYSGEDNDGDGKGDTVTEKTVTKEDYPDELGDKEDTANTPVQEPKGGEENPSYTMDKARASNAPEKGESGMHGFHRGDTVAYDVHITNTGDLPLTMYVTDEFDYRISRYFTGLKITRIDGTALAENGTGIGTTVAKIRLEPEEEAVVTFTATVTEAAPEKLAFHTEDDGNGYLNIAKTYHVRAEKPDGTEGGPDEYPGIPDKEDEANTPVQTEEEKPDYPYIWLLKNRIDDPDHVLAGGTFQVLNEDKSETVMEEFTMNSTWQQWNVVLEADKTYWLHEVSAPEGYLRAEDVKFTVSHYGEDIHVSMTDEPIEDKVIFEKEDLSGSSLRGAYLEVRKKGTDEAYAWVSNGRPHTISGKLKPGEIYVYHEISAPEGYVLSADIEFTLDEKGVVVNAHYTDVDGDPVLYDKDGFTTKIKVKEDGTYELGGESVRIDRDGNAVDKDRNVIAEGVKLEIDVTGNTIIMKDAPTDVTISKVDSVTGKSLAGVTLQVIDKAGQTIAEWTTDETGTFKLENKLTAGESYILREKATVDGYYYSRDVRFTVNEDGKPQTVEMRNRKIIVVTPPDTPDEPKPEKPIIWLLKHAVGDPDHILKGGTFQILSEDKTDVLIDSFTMDGSWQEWDVVLQADHSYWLHEVIPPEGYGVAEDVKFTVSHYGEDITVDMEDEPTDQIFKKTDSTTGKSLAGAVLQVIDKDGNIIDEWTTDDTGIHKLTKKLTAGETYILHEKETVEGYYYSYDVEFTVNADGESQVIDMRNREIKVVTPPDEFPEPTPEKQGTHPDYELVKERVSLAPAKAGTGEYGFFCGDRVLYDVTVTNTGETDLTMTVTDDFEIAGYFSTPEATAVRFYYKDGREGTTMGSIISMEGNEVKLKLAVGGYAVIRYEADVLDTAREFLSGHTIDDGLGYLNTARTTDVIGTYTEYSGEDKDGDGKGDTVTEKTITKEDYPDELGDKEDTANTPVQEPDEDGENPSYTMDKTRTTKAPEKGESGMYGFHRGDTVAYDVHITNTGDMPLTMYVTDEFDYRIRKHFEDLQIVKIDGEAIEEDGTGVGTTVAKIRIEPDGEAVVTFTAKVAETAPEKLSYHTEDDGNGYLNIAKTYHVRAEKPDGTEGGPDEYPGIPDKEDDSNTPVQTDDKPDYPFIWLLKNEVGDPDHILTGGTFQVLSEDKEHILIDSFTMNSTWQQWDVVLEADKSYWLHEVSAPAGYQKAEDVKFTVSHYGEDVQVVMSDEKLPTTVTFTKEDFAGTEIPGTECELKRVEPNGTTTRIDSWTSGDKPHVMEDILSGSTTYRYHEEKAPEGYGYSEDIEFTVDENGKVTDAHYVDKDGTPLLYDKDGFVTTITVQPDGTYKDGDTTVTINKDGNAVDRRGHIHAEGVKYEIEVVDNVVRMKDAPTQATILKRSTDGEALAGGQFVILREDGTILEALRDTQIPSTSHEGDIRKGEAVRFAAREDGVKITGLLNGSESYILHEEKAPDGYDLASDVKFVVPRDGKAITVTMHDAKTSEKPEHPSYTMDKTRTTEAPAKGSAAGYGFRQGDKVTYEAHIRNTGDLPLKMYVSDEYAAGAKEYFEGLKITKIDGEDISEDGMGIGTTTARIRIEPGKEAVITYEATVGKDVPESLSSTSVDDGKGYLNTVKTYEVKAEKPDGTEGGPDEYPDIPDKEDDAHTPVQEPKEPPKPDYELSKERVSEAPAKAGTSGYGFFKGDKVLYDVTVTNTGDMDLSMTVTDNFTDTAYFSEPKAVSVQFFKDGGTEDADMGEIVSLEGNAAKIKLVVGGYAVVRYEADVLEAAKELLSEHAVDDGQGYLNTARSTDVTGTYTEYSGEDEDGDGRGDIETEKTVSKEDYPDELGDKEDTANTPVQEPSEENPSYTMDKTRTTGAPGKAGTTKHGFNRGDTVTYEAHIRNTGDLALKMYVTDAFAEDVKGYFEGLKITKIDGEDISGAGKGIGTTTARIRIEPGKEAVVTFTATVAATAPEKLSFSAADDGNGYLNTVKTYEVKAEKPDGTEGGPDEYPGIPDKEDEAHTPVQTPEAPKPDYELTKERVSKAPEKGSSGKYGFFKGNKVLYDVTVRNTGETKLSMTVTDRFKDAGYFSVPEAVSVKFYGNDGHENAAMGQTVSLEGNAARIKLEIGGYAVIRYEADVLNAARELLSGHAVDDGLGYLNTARATDMVGTYIEYSGEDKDGDGKGDTETEKTVTKEDYPDELGDKEDTANTPVQEPEPTKPGKPSGGGGNTPSKPYVTVYKYDGNTMEPISGVTFQVYRDGEAFTKVKTDKNGYARVSSLEDGSYRITEAEAAKGYQATGQEFTFTVKNGSVAGGVTTFHMPNYRQTTVIVTKRDGDTGMPLKGARLRIADEDGGVAYEGVTDKDGKISFTAVKPGHYAVIELEAPDGYDVVDGYITFHVAEDGTVDGTTTMYDYKKERKGKITAKYENGFERGGWYDSDGRWHKLPTTGDNADTSHMPYLFGIFAASMCGIVLLTRKKKKA